MLTHRGRAYDQNHQLESGIHTKIVAIIDQPEIDYFSIGTSGGGCPFVDTFPPIRLATNTLKGICPNAVD